jgi:hypothetical protein
VKTPPSLATVVTKIRQYPIATAAFSISFLVVVAILIRATTLANLHDMLVMKEEQWTRMTNNLKHSRDLEEHVERINKANEVIGQRLMEPTDRALNDQYFYDLRKQSGVRLSNLTEGGVIDTKGSKLPGIGKFKEYSLISYSITVEGSFSQILEFSTRLATGKYFARISAFSIARAPLKEGGDLSLNMQLQILGVINDA